MPSYGILIYPSYNRVYFQSSKDLAIAELKVANNRLASPCNHIENRILAGVDYIVFETAETLSGPDIRILSRLSFVYALYELGTGDRTPLFPIEKDTGEYLEEDLMTILKYSGKTNEAFTRLLVNIGWLVSDSFHAEQIRLLDPICGKGTTLYQGLIYGFHGFGVEIDRNAMQQAVTFFTRYLKTKKYKHKLAESKLSENNKKICDVYKYEMANNKDAYKGGDTLKLEFVRGDTVQTEKFFKKNSMDILIGDLPYGVQHGSNTQSGSFTRNPENLLKAALPGWQKVMKTGGAMVLSFNTFVLKKEIIAEIITASGFKVLSGDPYDGFAHRVDQAIIRDLIVAKKA